MKKLKLKKNDKQDIRQALGIMTHIGITIIIIMFACIWFGNFLDKQLGTGPLLLFVFIILGMGASFRSLYVIAMGTINGSEAKKKRNKK